MMQLSEVPIPKRQGAGRPKEPNPYTDDVAHANANRGRAFRFLVQASLDSEEVTKIRSLINRAGRDLDVSARTAVETTASGKSTYVTFWVTDKITHADSQAAQADAELDAVFGAKQVESEPAKTSKRK